MKNIVTCFALFAFLLGTNAKAENTEMQNKKLTYVKGLGDFIFETMATDLSKEKKISKIKTMIEKEMDFEWNAKIALGSQGKSMSPEEFKKFTSLYRELLCQNWATKFSIVQMARKQDIVFSEKVVKMNATDDVISFYFEARNGNKIDIKIIVKTMDETAPKFKVTDLVAEGVSIALSYRSQFNAYIDENGIEAINPYLADIVKKNKEKDKEDSK